MILDAKVPTIIQLVGGAEMFLPAGTKVLLLSACEAINLMGRIEGLTYEDLGLEDEAFRHEHKSSACRATVGPKTSALLFLLLRDEFLWRRQQRAMKH